MSDPLPVHGYTKQSDQKVALVNENKVLEERVLRQIEKHLHVTVDRADATGVERVDVDLRMVALARTKVQEAFMWLNRAVFQPVRVKLPEDE